MKKRIVTILFVSICVFVNAQNSEIWIKNSPEVRLNLVNIPVEIRWRPTDQMIMPDHYFGKHSLIRTDLMLGLNIWKFKIFSYTKYDEFDEFWTGARLDFNVDFFDKKILLNIQERYFWGLNENSADHYYLVQYLRYVVTPKIRVGVLSYGKWKTEKQFVEGKWFVGLSVNIILPYNFNVMTAFTRNVLPDTYKIYMCFFRVGYRIKWDTNKKE